MREFRGEGERGRDVSIGTVSAPLREWGATMLHKFWVGAPEGREEGRGLRTSGCSEPRHMLTVVPAVESG